MIKVGYCVAYDWELLKHSIPTIYDEADLICISIDKERRSWAGQFFSWNQAGFEAMIRNIDSKGEVRIYEDDFYQADLTPMENEVRQRNMIAKFLGEGGWHVQLDADEYFMDFKRFVSYLNNYKGKRLVNICCPLINLYKQLPNGFLWIKPDHFTQIEFIAIATMVPRYEHGRKNGYFNILTNFSLLHQSWARTENEIQEKLENWGHKNDFHVPEYFNLWKNANENNFQYYRNFHHLRPEAWPRLEKIEVNSIEDMLMNKGTELKLPIDDRDLNQANSLWLSRKKKILDKAGKYFRR